MTIQNGKNVVFLQLFKLCSSHFNRGVS